MVTDPMTAAGRFTLCDKPPGALCEFGYANMVANISLCRQINTDNRWQERYLLEEQVHKQEENTLIAAFVFLTLSGQIYRPS